MPGVFLSYARADDEERALCHHLATADYGYDAGWNDHDA
jgi:hypothetical protein